MFKFIVLSVALLLLTAPGAFAGILQGQVLGVGSSNDLLLQHSQQNASASQNVLINMSQNTSGEGLGLTSATVIGTSHQFGGSGMLGLGLGVSSLASHAQLLTVGGGLIHMPLVHRPIGSVSLLHGLVLLGH